MISSHLPELKGRARWLAKRDAVTQARFMAKLFGIVAWSSLESNLLWAFPVFALVNTEREPGGQNREGIRDCGGTT
jgi:hypothetical protein